ncbi:MAG TPA: hypothetical protein VES88_10040 [Gemmatimonadaceae bacterium]|nr:hypothetical protein [Gemmatimonadaceae bacterium]
MEARTQMHYARRGEITDAMRFVAEREEIPRADDVSERLELIVQPCQ